MKKLFLVEEDNEAARSLAKKLLALGSEPEGIVSLSRDELTAFANNDVVEVTGLTNSHVELLEVDPKKKYIALVKRGKVPSSSIDRMISVYHNITVVMVQ